MVVYLNDEDVAELLRNPYVESATQMTVRFTDAFYERAKREMKYGIGIDEILRAMGINPWVLGDSRVYNIKMKIKQLLRDDKFDLQPEPRAKRPGISLERIRDLEHEVEYLKQEQQFLKKILKAADEATEK